MTQNSNTKISIIIPCYNEASHLPELFKAINNLKTDKTLYEVIIVDNGSSDRSVEIAKEHKIKVLIEPNANISTLRNIGANDAKGNVFAFLDADCLPLANWLNEVLKYDDQEDVGMFGSIPLCPEDGTWVEKAWFSLSPKGATEVGFLCTANMIIPKKVFNQVNGFDDSLTTGEDYDICQRIIRAGYKLIHDEGIAITHLRYPKTLIQRFKKELWYGKEMFSILKVNPLYKPFWISLIFGFSFIICIICTIMVNFGFLFYTSLLIFLVLPVLSAIFKVIQSKRYERYFSLCILYFIYLAGRFCAILISFKSSIRASKNQPPLV